MKKDLLTIFVYLISDMSGGLMQLEIKNFNAIVSPHISPHAGL